MLTELDVFKDMMNWLKFYHWDLYIKYHQLNKDNGRKFLRKVINHRIKQDLNYKCRLPLSVMDKLGVEYELYNGKDEMINKLVKKTGGKVKCIFSLREGEIE